MVDPLCRPSGSQRPFQSQLVSQGLNLALGGGTGGTDHGNECAGLLRERLVTERRLEKGKRSSAVPLGSVRPRRPWCGCGGGRGPPLLPRAPRGGPGQKRRWELFSVASSMTPFKLSGFASVPVGWEGGSGLRPALWRSCPPRVGWRRRRGFGWASRTHGGNGDPALPRARLRQMETSS